MRWWFYLTPLGWLDLYLTLVLLTHESGHFIVAYLTGHKIIRFKIGLREPVIKFRAGKILFEFSLDANGGCVNTDTTVYVSQIGILLTALAGPIFELSLATGILVFTMIFFGQSYGTNSLYFLYQTILLSLSFVTFWTGIEGLIRDVKNILKASAS